MINAVVMRVSEETEMGYFQFCFLCPKLVLCGMLGVVVLLT